MSAHLPPSTSAVPGRSEVAPAALTVLLAALTLGAWGQLLFQAPEGLRIANRSGAVLSGVRVCLPDGRCLSRRVLWPHESWQVPLPDGVRHAEVSVPGHLHREPVALRASGVARLIVGSGQVDVTP
ncbi:hypothetical protein CBQ26_06695 [Deinococcus indicus]|uniref:Uncharacterized protein n=1 Tax=Deinococcus indicus TaxID=223556 RepID=A0A246BQH7_9DEIO|nr:hypothetical protein [Deinococcus indicus]OWL97918.1 hypothetical protein CBQ26_06695 [Deinococcus indicus]GHG19110.1 hypothetical protein GCM10017784_07760 [Deinococcus indicus]